MDARLDPAKFSGLAEGECHSSATSAAAPARMPFGPWSFLTNCSEPANGLSFIILIAGMELFTNETMPELLEKSLETARLEEAVNVALLVGK